MAHWGVGYCNGPNYNFHTANGYYGLSAQETGYPSMKLAFEATARAAASAAGASVVERDLIDALAREQQIGGSGGSLEPLGLFLEPLGLFLRTSTLFIWRILTAFLPT